MEVLSKLILGVHLPVPSSGLGAAPSSVHSSVLVAWYRPSQSACLIEGQSPLLAAFDSPSADLLRLPLLRLRSRHGWGRPHLSVSPGT